jgi:hypothetical protein
MEVICSRYSRFNCYLQNKDTEIMQFYKIETDYLVSARRLGIKFKSYFVPLFLANFASIACVAFCNSY